MSSYNLGLRITKSIWTSILLAHVKEQLFFFFICCVEVTNGDDYFWNWFRIQQNRYSCQPLKRLQSFLRGQLQTIKECPLKCLFLPLTGWDCYSKCLTLLLKGSLQRWSFLLESKNLLDEPETATCQSHQSPFAETVILSLSNILHSN